MFLRLNSVLATIDFTSTKYRVSNIKRPKDNTNRSTNYIYTLYILSAKLYAYVVAADLYIKRHKREATNSMWIYMLSNIVDIPH